jgi:hypothetical protein
MLGIAKRVPTVTDLQRYAMEGMPGDPRNLHGNVSSDSFTADIYGRFRFMHVMTVFALDGFCCPNSLSRVSGPRIEVA